MSETTELFVTAVGEDRPGVVAALTGALAGLDANLEDTSMTILGGRFAMVLLVAVSSEHSRDDVDAALRTAADELHLDVTVHPAEASSDRGDAGGRWTLSMYGADHPGIVHGASSALADLGVNILDMRTRVVGDPDRTVYVMALDVAVPTATAADALLARLDEVAADLGIEISAHPVDDDIL